jgi:hemerythrin-like domain-containing protein
LYEEHDSLAAVLHALSALVREVNERDRKVDPKVFRAILYYLDVFLEREHHRKEESVLFPESGSARARLTPFLINLLSNMNPAKKRSASLSRHSSGMKSMAPASSRLSLRP